MIFVGKDALLRGIGISELAQSVLESLSERISAAVKAQSVVMILTLTDGRPVEFSDGEYLYIRSAGIVIIRVNGRLGLDEQVRVFFRELAEFLQRCEVGSCVTQEVWEIHAPVEYNIVKEMLDVRAW
jgi:hypothetical protein